jgi:dienelactone hydrolase
MQGILSAGLLCCLALQTPEPQKPVEARAGGAMALMAAGDFAAVEAQFTRAMKEAWPAAKLAAAWAGLSKGLGPYRECGPNVRVVRIADKQMVISSCKFGAADVDIQFAFDASGRISGLQIRPGARAAYTPPTYANPAAFVEEEVTIGSGEWALPGTLSLPKSTGRHPAVVLVHGSGQQDRDTSFGPNRPFKDLALGLASRGVAVLRYDKRNRVHAAKLADQPALTVREEVIDDAVQAVKLLRAHPRVDPARVFVLGKSLGGMLVPRIAQADPTVNGWIVMAGAARPLEEAILEQSRYLAAADGTISGEEQSTIDRAAALVERVRSLKPEDARSAENLSGAPASYWLDLRGYDPPAAATSIKSRMLVLQGERDYQVTMTEFARWKAALGSRSDVTFRSYPSLNHLFIAGTGPSLPAEYLVAGHVAEEVVRDIADWILQRPAKPR